MNEQQHKTLFVRVHVKRDIAFENLLTAIAKETLFSDIDTEELVNTIIELATVDSDTRADMIEYLDSERDKQS